MSLLSKRAALLVAGRDAGRPWRSTRTKFAAKSELEARPPRPARRQRARSARYVENRGRRVSTCWPLFRPRCVSPLLLAFGALAIVALRPSC
jgi:hypothetical protein